MLGNLRELLDIKNYMHTHTPPKLKLTAIHQEEPLASTSQFPVASLLKTL